MNIPNSVGKGRGVIKLFNPLLNVKLCCNILKHTNLKIPDSSWSSALDSIVNSS